MSAKHPHESRNWRVEFLWRWLSKPIEYTCKTNSASRSFNSFVFFGFFLWNILNPKICWQNKRCQALQYLMFHVDLHTWRIAARTVELEVISLTLSRLMEWLAVQNVEALNLTSMKELNSLPNCWKGWALSRHHEYALTLIAIRLFQWQYNCNGLIGLLLCVLGPWMEFTFQVLTKPTVRWRTMAGTWSTCL